MKRAKPFLSKNATVLILALWTLGFLSFFVLNLGLRARQKMTLVSRLEKRSSVAAIAEAGVRKARAVFATRRLSKGLPISVRNKQEWFNDAEQFRAVTLGPGSFEVSYRDYNLSARDFIYKYGLTDEGRRINVNKADRFVLARLIKQVVPLEGDQVNELARAIVDWREYGESEVTGFFSDAYYENLEFPYEPKKKEFETLDELLLVRGMEPEIYDKLLDFITVYGDGKVNINTASAPVLAALDMSPETVAKILIARRGPDGQDATADDYVFFIGAGGASLTLPQNMDIRPEELSEIDTLYVRGRLGVYSAYFRVRSTGRLGGSEESMTITCVFDGNSGRINYWNEKRATGDPEPESPSGLQGS